MSVASELAAQRRVTTDFIAAKPTTIELIPTIRVKTGNGGVALSDGPRRAAQVLRVIEQASAYGNNPGLIASQDGQQRRVRYQLLGEYFAVFAVGDYWLDQFQVRREIVELLPENGYERRGMVVSYG